MAFSYLSFLSGLVRNPRAVSAPTPSSAVLSDAIAAQVDPSIPGLVVELGPGTGVVTAALLRRGIAPERILAIEYDPGFAELLRARFAGIQVICGDAFNFERYLPEGKIAAIVSGLPLLLCDMRKRRKLLKSAMARQGNDKRFVQLSYSWLPPIAAPEVALKKTLVWQNLPPAHVWTYQAH
jgi:phosphatidylethanolamine/phosphatidyl-N-methylethanolamine N-methyltransferase